MSPRGEKLRCIARLAMGLAAVTAPALAVAQRGPGEAPALPSFLDDRRLQEIEAARRAAEEAARQKQESDARRKADDDRRLAAEAEAKRKAEELRRTITGEPTGKRTETGRGAGETETKADDEKRQAAEAEARRKAEEEKRQAEAEARRKAEDEKRQAEAERRRAEDEKRQAEAERRRAEEEKRQAEAERRKAEEEKRQAEAEARRKAEDEQRRRAAEAEARRKSEAAAPAPPTARAAVATPPKIAPAGTPCPPAKLTAEPLPGGRAALAIESECRAGQALTLSYGGLSLPAEFDAGGRYEATFDLFLGNDAPLEAVFADQTRARIAARGLDFERISKIAIVWRAPVNLDLHALEYTARQGGPGHVWASAPSSAESALEQSRKTARGRGFLSTAADAAAEGDKVEVYTFWHADGQESGAVSLMVDYESRGDLPRADACGSGPLASIEFRVVRLGRGAAAPLMEKRALAAAPCGKPLPTEARFNPDSMPHLLIRR